VRLAGKVLGMSYLWDIAQAHLDAYGVRAAALARRMGTAPQTLDSWKNRGVRSLPTRDLLEALARETRTPYRVVLDAALRDIDYMPRESDGDGDAPPTTMSSAEWDRNKAALQAGPGRRLTDCEVVDTIGQRPMGPATGEVPVSDAGDVMGQSRRSRRQA
jgi:transcriptional regulator with XRE-family HTH domain